jgi:hypothetical protein
MRHFASASVIFTRRDRLRRHHRGLGVFHTLTQLRERGVGAVFGGLAMFRAKSLGYPSQAKWRSLQRPG